MQLSDIKVLGPILESNRAHDSDVDALEEMLGFEMPRGYREYVTTLGYGVLADNFIVYTPDWLFHYRDCRSKYLSDYWFWGDGNGVLAEEQVGEAVDIAHYEATGDIFVVHPTEKDRIVLLPRHYETTYWAGNGGLYEAIEWAHTEAMGVGVHYEIEDWRVFSPITVENAIGKHLPGA